MTAILLPVIIVAIIGLVCGLGLALASKFMAVTVDERQKKIQQCLPGANCGACGYSGCDGYAAAIVSGKAAPNLCIPGGSTTAAALSDILGIEISAQQNVAFIACAGSPKLSLLKYEYTGMESCAAANIAHGGPLQCEFGCIGFGDCIRACNFGAIKMINGRPTVCEGLCSGCGMCAAACPKGVINIIPKDTAVRTMCSNKARGPLVAKQCKVSCIACRVCEKNCPQNAIKVENNLAVIDYSLCTGCGKCKDVCKRKVII